MKGRDIALGTDYRSSSRHCLRALFRALITVDSVEIRSIVVELCAGSRNGVPAYNRLCNAIKRVESKKPAAGRTGL